MNNVNRPNVILLAGPNGSGKSTSAPAFLKGALGVTEFVNADVIAQGLSGFAPGGAALEASRIMFLRLRKLAEQRVSFAFETTLAGKTLAPWLAELARGGYDFHLLFLWLPSADAAVARVAERVRMGGHDVPEETIRHRYAAGLRNFFRLYRPLTRTWRVYDNSQAFRSELIAAGQGNTVDIVVDSVRWLRLQREYGQ
jgi:predicted ABC-type ATPase